MGSAYSHRILNFAEDLHRLIVRRGWGEMSDIDRASETVWVEIKSKRHLGECWAIIRKELARHFNDGGFTLTKS
jgi:hypothetical protein